MGGELAYLAPEDERTKRTNERMDGRPTFFRLSAMRCRALQFLHVQMTIPDSYATLPIMYWLTVSHLLQVNCKKSVRSPELCFRRDSCGAQDNVADTQG